ncbi:MAG: tRNA threonylcarbamoyladenosine dehydratase [Clostridia bacterium]|nr:tRNA threonylcarbamoyladenosine dehydratase [Clostridia bacterium]
MEKFLRNEMLFGKEALKKLNSSRVAVFGIGGVGGYALEALVRAGVGEIDIVDSDLVATSNINRQIIATAETVGKKKVDVAEARAKAINPDVKINQFDVFYLPETAHLFDFKNYDYVIDAIDTVSGKMELIRRANECGTPIICSMGTGNKLDPTAFEVADIHKTSVCPLAKVIRQNCKREGIKHLKVVYSKEIPAALHQVENAETKGNTGRTSPASCSFVPPVAGFILAGEVIKDLIKMQNAKLTATH